MVSELFFFFRNFVRSCIWIGMFYVFFSWQIRSNVALFWWHPPAWCRVPQSFEPVHIIAFVNQFSNTHRPQGAFTTGFYSQALVRRFNSIPLRTCKSRQATANSVEALANSCSLSASNSNPEMGSCLIFRNARFCWSPVARHWVYLNTSYAMLPCSLKKGG